MAKMSIYLPDELKERMDGKSSENWSSIAQKAFELQINSTTQGGDDMNAVIERLRASKEKIELVERPEWVGKGRSWASDIAEYEELKRVGEIENDDYDDETDPRGEYRFLALASAVFGDRDVNRDQLGQLRVFLTGDDRGRISGRQVTWFVEGAQSIWEEVGDAI